jgi:hypothetical protein
LAEEEEEEEATIENGETQPIRGSSQMPQVLHRSVQVSRWVVENGAFPQWPRGASPGSLFLSFGENSWKNYYYEGFLVEKLHFLCFGNFILFLQIFVPFPRKSLFVFLEFFDIFDFFQSKFWYDHSAVRHVGPFLLLALYAGRHFN